MAKDKAKGGKAKAKPGRRIPKEIGGFKIPKELRKSGEALLDKAASPEGKAMLAGGLTMAAAAAAAAIERAGRRAGESGRAANDARPGEPARDPQAMADAVGKAVDTVVSRLFGRQG